MKIHFNELFAQKNGYLYPKVDIHVGDSTYTSTEGFSDQTKLFGDSYSLLTGKVFELTALSEGGYDIKGYYVN